MTRVEQKLSTTSLFESSQGWKVWAFTAIIGYIVFCTTLRHNQKRAMELAEQQFPSVFSAAIFFALFKVFIPSISRLLATTRQFGKLGDIHATSKRAADTSVLLTNMIMRPPGSPQARLAVARTNYLHNIYRRTGRISNDDMLYTLSLFTLQPMRWTAIYDWRPLSDMERCALATCFKVWGEDLEITYEALPSHSQGWSDGLHWLDELDSWSQQYEEHHVEVSDFNVEVVNATRELVLCQIPKGLHGVVWGIVAIVLGPQVRRAMRITEPSNGLELVFNSMITLRKYILRYACPPRPYFLRRVFNCDQPDPDTGRYQSQRWLGRPWYVKTSAADRWSLPAWMLWLNGTASTTVFDNKRFIAEGYLIEDVGSEIHVGKGREEMHGTVSLLDSKPTTRCPFIH
ncbi:hypothetical protein GGS24DRAFT_495443 [Hypoxylon argillaceum]|nr:hypothetical protein GGS24DRAFT_495443 [Hypoxylon argillaceum]